MKKALILFALITASASFGASFDWGTGTVVSSFAGTTFNSTDYNVIASLVLLGNDGTKDLYSVAGDALTPATAADTAKPTTTGAARNKGKITGTFDSTSIVNDQVYGMFLTYTDANSNVWYNFSTSTYTVTGLVDDRTQLSPATFAFNFTSKTETTADQVSVGGGWYHVITPTVPEPSLAAMALLGLGMMLKRRKA